MKECAQAAKELGLDSYLDYDKYSYNHGVYVTSSFEAPYCFYGDRGHKKHLVFWNAFAVINPDGPDSELFAACGSHSAWSCICKT